MSINPILMNATIQRVQDFSNMKQNVDQKSAVEQSMIQHNVQKTEQQKANQVIRQDNADMMHKKFDARERGGNAYKGDGGRNRKHQEPKKGVTPQLDKSGGFDMKI